MALFEGGQRLGEMRLRLMSRRTPVPRFFIDTSDQQHFVRDKVGYELPDVDAARDAAIEALPDMARDVLPDGDARTFLAVVRDEQNRTLLQASLSLGVVWMTEAHMPTRRG